MANSSVAKHNGLIVSEWIVLTTFATALATGAEALLLERKYSFFSGGFLADVSLGTLGRQLVFLLVAFVTDLSLIAPGVALVLWRCAVLRLRPAGRVLFSIGLPLIPIVWFDFTSFQVNQYVGDIFNVAILFELSGRSIREFFAVAGVQIAMIIALLFAAVFVLFGLAWLLNKYWPLVDADPKQTWSSGRKVRRYALIVCATGAMCSIAGRLADEAVARGIARKATGLVLTVGTRMLTDVDRDGYGFGSRPRDPAPFDASIHPYALEVEGDGIDQNGIGGDLPVSPEPLRHLPPARFAEAPPVILVFLESFRADLLFRTHQGVPVTPHLNHIAKSGSYTRQAYSHNGWTTYSRYHLLTGSLAYGLTDGTLLDDFLANGYDVAAFSGQDESSAPELEVGFRRATAFSDARDDVEHRYSDSTSSGSLAIPHGVVEARLAEYLRSRRSDKPLFVYLNFQETHFPYGYAQITRRLTFSYLTRSDIRPENAGELRSQYDNAAAVVDAAVSRAIVAVRDHTGQEPLLLVVPDHAESLFDDGMLGHGTALTDTQTRVPLIVSRRGITFPAVLGLADVRTLLWRMLGDGAAVSSRDADTAQTGVFQYLGDLRSARKIALREPDRRIVVDLHEGTVSVEGSAQRLPLSADGGLAQTGRSLVHTWERLQIDSRRTSR